MSVNPLRIEWGGRTDQGSVRTNNEDRFIALPEAGIWVVADGMGGHERGDWASEQIIAAVERVLPLPSFDELIEACSEAIHAANQEIFSAAAEDRRMGSTVVGLVVSDRRFGILWAGDSRAYLLRGDNLHQLTQDHTQVQAMVERGLLTAEEARSHAMNHILTRAVGVEGSLELDAIADDIYAGDMFLLCSDGLHGTLDEAEVRDIMATHSPSETATRLITRCLEDGARDNVTAIVVQAQEPTLLSFAGVTALPDGGSQ